MSTNEVTSSAAASTVALQASPAALLTDRETLEGRATHAAALLYRASSIAGAAKLAVRDLEGGVQVRLPGQLVEAIGVLFQR
jgi:hypothetical protein